MSIVTVITPAASKGLTTPAAVVARMGEGDPTSQTVIDVVANASDAIVGFCHGRVFGLETVQESFQRVNNAREGALVLARRPVASIVSVTIYGTVIDPQWYEFDPAAGLLWRIGIIGEHLPWYGRVIVVRYQAGYALPADENCTLPMRYQEAAILTCVAMLTGAGRDPTLRTVTNEGVGAYAFGNGGTGTIPLAAIPLLDGDADDVLIA